MSGSDVRYEEFSREEEIKAKRLARRKNILENAKLRLEKINGKASQTQNGSNFKPDNTVYPDPEVEQDLFDNLLSSQPRNDTGLSSFNVDTGEDIIALLERLRHTAVNGNGIAASTFERRTNFEPAYQTSQTNPDSFLTTLMKAKAHIALISLITYFLFATGYGSYITHSVFLPLLLWEIVEVLLVRKNDLNDASITIQLLVFLTALPPNYLLAVTKIINTLNKIFKDVGVFVFFFALNHLAYYTIFHSSQTINAVIGTT